MFLWAGRAGSVSHQVPFGAGQSGHQKLMLCFFFPVLFALVLEEFCTDWSSGVMTPGKGCPGTCGVSIPGDAQTQSLLQLPLLWARGWDQTIPRGAFQPHPSMILWETGKDFKKSPERQRGAQWLLFRVSFQVFPPSQQEQEQPQFSVPVLSVTHTHAIPNIHGEQDLRNDSHEKELFSPAFPNSVNCTDKSEMLLPGQLTWGSFRCAEKLGLRYQRHFWNPPGHTVCAEVSLPAPSHPLVTCESSRNLDLRVSQGTPWSC